MHGHSPDLASPGELHGGREESAITRFRQIGAEIGGVVSFPAYYPFDRPLYTGVITVAFSVEVRMNPYYNVLDPFGGAGLPGDPMESVLSMQTFNAGDAVVYEKITGVCHLNTFHTNSCQTSQCDTICSTQVCSTGVCSYGAKTDADVGIVGG
jgi:hypothetical protein